MLLALSLAFTLQGPVSSPVASVAWSTPASGDTIGYWQQRVAYLITATLDERRGVVTGFADLTYVNNSPDTLRELYVHQHLNAFRPGSAWSRADEREGRVRFQNLADPDYAYERFTSVPLIDGAPVTPRYPGAPDSTVVVFTLPRPLAPGDSIRARFQWEARPSTLPRRQGRRGRSFDLAQWYPRVAVYDRGGWQPNPLVPAGEFYGEFGSYDVTLIVPQDQVIGATGVPVEGDPGWRGALRHGAVHSMSGAYGNVERASPVTVPAGFKRVRFVARDVHHFAWSAAPDYRYEGGSYVRRSATTTRFPTWDTVAVHVLYQPGDEATWGGGVVVDRTIAALTWLEQVFGPYGYPQVTTLHRIEGGGTEFPMMMMNGSPSQGLILHEGGHIYAHGILASNEWRSGWMDEGLTSYQTAWATRSTPQDRPRLDSIPTAPRAAGYRGRAVRPDPAQAARVNQQRLVFVDRAEPMGTRANDFNEFAIYNGAVYTSAEIMYGALREVLGDSVFAAFLHDYYARWAFRHVDERAMRASAERVSGKDLRWFFAQWVHDVGNVDYALGDLAVEQGQDGAWLTRARVRRRGEYLHPMPFGVRTATGWALTRIDTASSQVVEVRSAHRPIEVQLDPYQTTHDWDRRNDAAPGPFETAGRRHTVFDWPFLDQVASDRQLTAIRPWLMYADPGGLAVGVRARSGYQGWIDRAEAGFASTAGLDLRKRSAADPSEWNNIWFSLDNPTLRRSRPLVGLRIAGWHVDDAVRADIGKTWDVSRFTVGPRDTRTVGFTMLTTNGLDHLSADDWDDAGVYELSFAQQRRWVRADSAMARATVTAGVATPAGVNFSSTEPYARAELEARMRRPFDGGRTAVSVRTFLGYVTSEAPRQRDFRLSAQDPVQAFANHFLRPRGAPLNDPDVQYTHLGGGGLRGHHPTVAAAGVVALNLEAGRVLLASDSMPRAPRLWFNVFADAAVADVTGSRQLLADAGVGLAIRGMVFDQPIRIRLDAPLLMSKPSYAVGADGRRQNFAARWTFSFTDLW